jgi:hypothetical protein
MGLKSLGIPPKLHQHQLHPNAWRAVAGMAHRSSRLLPRNFNGLRGFLIIWIIQKNVSINKFLSLQAAFLLPVHVLKGRRRRGDAPDAAFGFEQRVADTIAV